MQRIWITIVMAALVVGCGTPPAKNNGGGKNNTTNNGTNSRTNNETNNGAGTIQSMNFALRNTGDSSVFVSPRPLRIFDGDEQLATDIYACSCGLECPAIAPAPIQELRPGQTLDWSWSGVVDTGGGDCSSEGMLGRELEAEFCYGRNFRGPDEFDGEPTDVVCERVPFEIVEACPECDQPLIALDVDLEVRPVEPPVVLALENQSGAALYVQEVVDCSVGAWFDVRHINESLQLRQPCDACDCSEGPDCVMGCAEACPQDAAVEVPAGETHTVELAGTYFRYYDEAGYQCTQTQYLPDPLTAELCFGTDVTEEGGSQMVSNVTCEEVQFTLEQREARLVVE